MELIDKMMLVEHRDILSNQIKFLTSTQYDDLLRTNDKFYTFLINNKEVYDDYVNKKYGIIDEYIDKELLEGNTWTKYIRANFFKYESTLEDKIRVNNEIKPYYKNIINILITNSIGKLSSEANFYSFNPQMLDDCIIKPGNLLFQGHSLEEAILIIDKHYYKKYLYHSILCRAITNHIYSIAEESKKMERSYVLYNLKNVIESLKNILDLSEIIQFSEVIEHTLVN